VEDGLVSTLGFISGIAVAEVPGPTLLLTGTVLIFVEGFSMAAGSFLSDESAREFRSRRTVSLMPSILGSIVMFIAYLAAGALVLAPYAVAYPAYALPWSIGLSLAALFLLGLYSARISGVPPASRAVRMVIIGGVAIGLGVFVARTLQAM
jgi:VIT1/CCC1 family predicted Fe2+/Mn2+ transporter